MNRFHQGVLIFSTLALSWFAMMAVHELGHVVGAWLTGGRVAQVVLHPLTISRTDLANNPHPRLVAWAGPVFGVILPGTVGLIAECLRLPGWYVLRFFAGFCLIANGAYLGIGSIDRVGDAGDLLRHGASSIELWAFGAVCALTGFFLWHRLGLYFGLGNSQGKVDKWLTYVISLTLVLTTFAMSMFGGE